MDGLVPQLLAFLAANLRAVADQLRSSQPAATAADLTALAPELLVSLARLVPERVLEALLGSSGSG